MGGVGNRDHTVASFGSSYISYDGYDLAERNLGQVANSVYVQIPDKQVVFEAGVVRAEDVGRF